MREVLPLGCFPRNQIRRAALLRPLSARYFTSVLLYHILCVGDTALILLCTIQYHGLSFVIQYSAVVGTLWKHAETCIYARYELA